MLQLRSIIQKWKRSRKTHTKKLANNRPMSGLPTFQERHKAFAVADFSFYSERMTPKLPPWLHLLLPQLPPLLPIPLLPIQNRQMMQQLALLSVLYFRHMAWVICMLPPSPKLLPCPPLVLPHLKIKRINPGNQRYIQGQRQRPT